MTFTVPAGDAGPWSFRLGPDYGRSGALFIDGVKVADATYDLWWSYDYNNTGQMLIVNNMVLGAGEHTVETIGFVGCCAGGMSMQFRIGGDDWQDVTVANLTPADSDGDGVDDDADLCPNTPLGATVDANGCSGAQNIARACLCDAAWKNHGAYVSCVAHSAQDQVAAGLISETDKGAIVSSAAQNSCGKKK